MNEKKATTIKEALKNWESRGGPAKDKESSVLGGEEEEEEEEEVRNAWTAKELDLQLQWPPIEQMDKTLGTLDKCERLLLSTNMIEKIQGLHGMSSLKVLSLSRNHIKLISGIEAVADTLEELWLSYNHLVALKGIQVMHKLKVLYVNYNHIRDWAEVARLAELPAMVDASLIGNPITEHMSEEEWRAQVFKRAPNLRRLDGQFRTIY